MHARALRGKAGSRARSCPAVAIESGLARAVELLERRFGLEALVLFGSHATDATHRESDVDLAALFRRRPDPLELLDAQTELEAILRVPVDLVDLRQASPILAMQVLRTGRCVFGASSPELASFAAILPSRYADLKRTRSEAERALIDRIADDRP